MTLDDFKGLLDNGGAYAVLLAVIFAWLKGLLVRGAEYERALDQIEKLTEERDTIAADRDRWAQTATSALRIGERATGGRPT